MDVLTGREKAARDLFSFILPGSRRLITEDGMFGDNRDVLAPQPPTGVVGASFSGGGRGRAGDLESDRDVAGVELAIDVAIFEDGLCVGPDESDLRESLTEQMQRQKDVAHEIVRALRDGAGPGRIFEMLRPLAQHKPHHTPLISMFARLALNQLIKADDTTLPDWFGAAAAISPLRLHPPS
jgi:hypothetical protein